MIPFILYIKGVIIIFYSGNFYLNKIYSQDKSICLAIISNDDILNEYGLSYSEDVTLLKSSNTTSYYVNESKDIDNITLELYYVDEENKLLVWDEEKLKDTLEWITSDDFIPFVSEDNIDLTYYVKAIKIIKKFNYQKKGYLEVTFKPFSNYAYKEFIKPLYIRDEKMVNIYNYSNVESDYKPIIEVENLGDENTVISFENLRRHDGTFEIKGLKKNQKVVIDMLTGIVQDIDTGENLISKCNRNWLRMDKGGCNFKFSGSSQIVFKAQFPIMV